MLYVIAAAFIVPNALVIYVLLREFMRTILEIQHNRGCEPATITTDRN